MADILDKLRTSFIPMDVTHGYHNSYDTSLLLVATHGCHIRHEPFLSKLKNLDRKTNRLSILIILHHTGVYVWFTQDDK